MFVRWDELAALSSRVAVWSIHEERGVFGAHRRARSQFTNNTDHVDGYVRTIGPVTKILGESFSVAIDHGSYRYLRHCSDLDSFVSPTDGAAALYR
jgi:hypothetical protein